MCVCVYHTAGVIVGCVFYHVTVCLGFQLSPLIVCMCIYVYLCMGRVIRGPKVETVFRE